MSDSKASFLHRAGGQELLVGRLRCLCIMEGDRSMKMRRVTVSIGPKSIEGKDQEENDVGKT